jgi:ribosomal RNA assembly protein
MTDIVTEIIRIPSERAKMLTGSNTENRKKIEKRCKVSITIQDEGEVGINGDTTDVFFARDVIRAIGRGFEVKDALRLTGDNYGLYIFPLKELIGSERAIVRLKGRVIGENGKTKKDIEQATESVLSIYGNTIGIIARMDTIEYAKEAVSMLLDGAPHSAVSNYLAKAKRRIIEERLRGS